ncbi:MAG: preprotein translocase subunit SecG [Verrucomicrobiae bacterium]|nr:preprotein translocase subunit SecG [Verrucomicrobiae bacterium]
MWTNFIIIGLQIILVPLCAFMVLLILMQRPKQEGLGAAFGSGMTESVFGADTSNVLSRLTVWCVVLFFGIILTLSSLYAHRSTPSSEVQKALTEHTMKPTSVSTNILSLETNVMDLTTNLSSNATNQP